jgi:tRNA pseudouridine55 synthase
VNGVLVVDKPSGVSSASVVAHVKRVLAARRVGHTGTLDPLATGVLPLCIDDATKIAGYLLAADKAYEGELMLGVETDTLDAAGEVTREAPVDVPRDALAAAMRDLVGASEQTPPMHSAIKQDGVPLYRLAYQGVEVERPPRPIRVDAFELGDYAPPRAAFSVACSKGTYVRVLVADVGRALGCGAHLIALRRTRCGAFTLDRAVALDDVTADTARAHLIDPAAALNHLPGYRVPAAELSTVRHGRRVPASQLVSADADNHEVFRLLGPQGVLLALARVEDGRMRYLRVFSDCLT